MQTIGRGTLVLVFWVCRHRATGAKSATHQHTSTCCAVQSKQQHIKMPLELGAHLTSRSWLCIDGDSTSSNGSSAAAEGYLGVGLAAAEGHGSK
jgi:hypothetical protein